MQFLVPVNAAGHFSM